MAKRTKMEMLEEMNDHRWIHDCTKNSSYADIKEAYEVMQDELSSDCDMYPNGRDHDAENFE